ncbi:MAG: hypothetical protein HWD59_02360 [Coxiellaceae bacterium]|nr:MAG: hypothetical protein HWD59_02360 [Coxiellaceae bacterium]
MVIPDDSCEKTIHDSITAIFSAVMPNDNFGFDIHVIFTQLMNGLKAAKQDHYIVSLRQNIIKVYFEKLNDELSEFFHTYQTASIANIEENITLLFKRHGITEALDGSVIHP